MKMLQHRGHNITKTTAFQYLKTLLIMVQGVAAQGRFGLEARAPVQQRIPMPIAMNVPNVPPLCIIVLPTPPISSRPLMPILR